MHNLNVTLIDERWKDKVYNLYLDQHYQQDPLSTDEKPLPPIGVSLYLFGASPEVQVSSNPPIHMQEGLKLIAEGHAQRHPLDNFSKVLGRKIAWMRLLDAEDDHGERIFDRATRRVLWNSYKNHFRFVVHGGR